MSARSFRASAANKCRMESTSGISAQRPRCSPATISGTQATNSSSSTLASFRSGRIEATVNKLWTGSEKTRVVQQSTLANAPCGGNATPSSCQGSSSRTQRRDPDGAALRQRGEQMQDERINVWAEIRDQEQSAGEGGQRPVMQARQTGEELTWSPQPPNFPPGWYRLGAGAYGQ
jgi:hypothetical protein